MLYFESILRKFFYYVRKLNNVLKNSNNNGGHLQENKIKEGN